MGVTTEEVLWPDDVGAGEIMYPAGGTFGPRIQPHLQLVFIHSGSMTVYIDDIPYQASGNTVTILFPGHREYFVFSKESETWHSYVAAFYAKNPDTLITQLQQLPRTIPLSPPMNDLVRRALALKMESGQVISSILKALIAEMLWSYINEALYNFDFQVTHRLHPAVEKAQQFIHIYLSEKLTLKTIAEGSSVSSVHLIRLFRAELNTTPMAYVWRRRVEIGIEMLKRTGLQVGLIAERCGFQTYHHFSRRVHLATGLSPREIRKQTWKQR